LTGEFRLRFAMAQDLLAYISSDFSDADVDDLRRLVERLGMQGRWSRGTPQLVDQFEEDSRTRPEDEPVRTVGIRLLVSTPGEHPPTAVAEITRVVDALTEFSGAQGVDFELDLEDTHVGEIQSGVPDQLVREGLIARR